MVDEFGANGSGAGGASEASPGTNAFHFPDVATSTTGNYLVVWSDAGSATDTSSSAILAKVNGTGPLITINTTTAGDQSAAPVAACRTAAATSW